MNYSSKMLFIVKVKVAQSCLTLCDPRTIQSMEFSRPEYWSGQTFAFSRGSSQPWDRTQVSRIVGGFITSRAAREAQEYWSKQPIPSPAGLPDPGIQLGSPTLQADSLPTELSGKKVSLLISIPTYLGIHGNNDSDSYIALFNFQSIFTYTI